MQCIQISQVTYSSSFNSKFLMSWIFFPDTYHLSVSDFCIGKYMLSAPTLYNISYLWERAMSAYFFKA